MDLTKNKGKKGYIADRTKKEIIRTVIKFLIPLTLYAAGFLMTKTRLNWLTIVAILGVLPASKNAVTMILYIKSHGISEEDYQKISPYIGENLIASYDNVFTTYENTYEVPSLVIRGGNICGCVTKEYLRLAELETHLKNCVQKEGYQVNVKIFEKTDAYITRLQSLAKLEETNDENSLAIRSILFDISL